MRGFLLQQLQIRMGNGSFIVYTLRADGLIHVRFGMTMEKHIWLLHMQKADVGSNTVSVFVKYLRMHPEFYQIPLWYMMEAFRIRR